MSYKDSINYLLNCAFSIPGNKTLFIPQDSVGVEQGSELLYPEGPLITSIAPDHAMVIVTSSNKVGIWVNNNTTERLSVPLNHKEVVLDNFKMQLYTQHIDYHRKIIGVLKPQSGGMQISISYDFSALNQENVNRFIENLPDDFNPNNLLSIIEKIISSEVQATLNHLFEDILLKSSSKEISGNSQTVGIVNKIQSIDGRFPAKPFSINYYQNPARQKSKRLRKRPIYAATYLQSKKQIIAESYSSNFSSEFNKTGIIQNIQTAILILFGFDFINIKEISIREIE